MGVTVILRLLDAAHCGQELDLSDGVPIYPDNPAMVASICRLPDRQVPARRIRELLFMGEVDPRGVRLCGAHVDGPLDLEGVSTDRILHLRGCYIPDGVIARDAQLAVLRIDRCWLDRPLSGERLVASALALTGTKVNAQDPGGAVDLRGARLGQLDCDRANLTNKYGPSLNGDSLRVELDVWLRHVEAIGAGPDGAVCLRGARARRVECDGATLCNTTGPAFRADSLNVELRAFLRSSFTADGTGEDGTLRLNGAQLGILACGSATIRNSDGPAIVAESMHAARGAFFGPDLTADGHGADAVVRLTGTRVTGRLKLDLTGLRNTRAGGPRLALDGLTYAGLPEPAELSDWKQVLRETVGYTPQPYQQLAAGYRAAGQDREAREVLIAQRKAELRSDHLSRPVRAWIRFTGVMLGYGYKPWRAVLGLVGVAAAAVALACALGGFGGLAHPGPAASEPCTIAQMVAVGLDWSIPLVKTDARQVCVLTMTPTGQLLTIAGWLLQVLGWLFATLFVAAFTAVVRRPGS